MRFLCYPFNKAITASDWNCWLNTGLLSLYPSTRWLNTKNNLYTEIDSHGHFISQNFSLVLVHMVILIFNQAKMKYICLTGWFPSHFPVFCSTETLGIANYTGHIQKSKMLDASVWKLLKLQIFFESGIFLNVPCDRSASQAERLLNVGFLQSINPILLEEGLGFGCCKPGTVVTWSLVRHWELDLGILQQRKTLHKVCVLMSLKETQTNSL